MTHIALTTPKNQQVTIDMPMNEMKRILVRQRSLVVEDKDLEDYIPTHDLPYKEPSRDFVMPRRVD